VTLIYQTIKISDPTGTLTCSALTNTWPEYDVAEDRRECQPQASLKEQALPKVVTYIEREMR
jgi:hypothetical protein